MAKDRHKIEKKRRKEIAKAKRAMAHAAAKKRDTERLKVVVDPTGGDAVLVKRIESIAKDISLEESGGCPSSVADVIARYRRDGPDEAERQIRIQAALKYDHHREIEAEPSRLLHSAVLYVGERVFEQLPETYRTHLLPNYYFYALVAPEGVRIQFGFLERVKRDTGWGYYSQHKPTVTINGIDWIVCFSQHAIERIVERSSFDEQPTYAHYMDCANYFDGCVYFERVTMAKGTPAIRLFMNEGLGGRPTHYLEYLRKVAGIEDINQYSSPPAYVLGYCNLDCKGKFAKATSFWYPGYDGTPEDTMVRSAYLHKDAEKRLRDLAVGNKTVRVINEGRHEAIRWYHDNGVPQVVFLKNALFQWAPHRRLPRA